MTVGQKGPISCETRRQVKKTPEIPVFQRGGSRILRSNDYALFYQGKPDKAVNNLLQLATESQVSRNLLFSLLISRPGPSPRNTPKPRAKESRLPLQAF